MLVEQKPKDLDQGIAIQRFEQAIDEHPPRGAGLHNALTRSARLGRNAGLTAEEVEAAMEAGIPDARPDEIPEAIRTVFTTDAKPRESAKAQFGRLTIAGGAAVAERLISAGGGGGLEALKAASPIKVSEDPEEMFRQAINACFEDAALLWVGDKGHRAKVFSAERVKANAKLAVGFVHISTANYTGMSGLNPKGEESYRLEELVQNNGLALIEFDKGTIDRQADIILGLLAGGADIASICDSGKKSLHALVRISPAVESLEEWNARWKHDIYRNLIAPIGADGGTANFNQLTRLPGHLRRLEDGSTALQRLVYAAGGRKPNAPSIAEVIAGAAAAEDFDRRAETSAANGTLGGRKVFPLDAVVAAIREHYCIDEISTIQRHLGATHLYQKAAWRKLNPEAEKGWLAEQISALVVNGASANAVRNVALNLYGPSGGSLVPDEIGLPYDVQTNTPAPGWVHFENGLFNLMTGQFRNHTHTIFGAPRVGYNYDPAAKAPKFNDYLKGVQPTEEGRRFLQHMCGYLLSGSTALEVFFMLYGPQGSGKSTILTILEHLIGLNNCATLNFGQYANRFCTSIFAEKIANICSEISPPTAYGDRLRAEELIKAAASGDTISIEEKNKHPRHGKARMRSVFSCNTLPEFVDRSGALWVRARILPFMEQFRGTSRQIASLGDKIAATELSGVFNWAYAGFSELKGVNQFPADPRGAKLLAGHQAHCDIEREFLSQHVEPDPDGAIRKVDLYSLYRIWIAGDNGHPLSRRRFALHVRRVFPTVAEGLKRIDGKPTKSWAGLRFINPIPPHTID